MIVQMHFSFTGSKLNKATIFIFSHYIIVSPSHHIDDNWLPMNRPYILWSNEPFVFLLESILFMLLYAKEIKLKAEILYSVFLSIRI